MISWWIGSASRPHGLGQCGCGVPGFGDLPIVGFGFASSHPRTATPAFVLDPGELQQRLRDRHASICDRVVRWRSCLRT